MPENFACIIGAAVVDSTWCDAAFAAFLVSIQYNGWERLVPYGDSGAGIGWTWTEQDGFQPPPEVAE